MKIRDLHFVKVLYAALLFLLLSAPSWTNANPVSERLAREVGAKFISVNTAMRVASEDLQLVTTYRTANDEAAFHIFNTPNGFVIVSADDCATPILGYSEEGQFDMQNIPIQLQDYLQDFVEQIQYGIENRLEAKETIVREWELVRTTGRLTENRDGEMVEPLITAMWAQGCYYNAMCPEDEDGPCGHCVTGCVATAMAQIMHYWGYPIQGTGSHSYTIYLGVQYANFGETVYDWANMPNQLTSTQAEVDAVSTLMYHCGVSVNMAYTPVGSGASVADVINALKTYFDYSTDIQFFVRANYSDSTWINMLKSDLNQSRPILYSGSSPGGGHAFVCDGYDVNDRFHINWGWGGILNGYYFIGALQDYNYYNGAIFNIYPNAGISHQVTASASPSDAGTVVGAGLYDIGSICTLTATANADYTFMYWTENDEVVSTHAEYSFCVRKDRDLVAHFSMPFQVEVVLDPVEGGTVSGVGEYAYGSTCTLTAMPDEGYDFICWRRTNGSVVSTASTYTFTVTEATTLIAVFAVSGGEQIAFADLNVKAICVAYWDSNGDGELSFAEAAAVTNIGGMFSNNAEITAFDELQYFTGLTSIGSSAFYGCSKLISIEIPNHVTIIGDSAFYGCSSLTGSLIIPNSVTTIDRLAFAYCRGFTGSLTIGNSVTSIGESAFFGCSGFTGSLTIGNSVTSIGSGAFSGCSGFTGSLTIGNSVTSVGSRAFDNCFGFTGSLTIGNSVTSIGGNAFYNCFGFTGSLTIGDSVTSIGEGAFYNCRGFTGSLTIGNSVTTIESSAFSGCINLTGNLTIPNSVTSIGEAAFYNCSGFTGSLTIGNSVTSIGSGAFSGCSGFTGNLTVPNSVTTIGDFAFSGCSGFTGSLAIGDSVTSIGVSAFDNCIGFTGDLIIPNSVTTIYSYAFFGCSGFTGSLTIGDSVTSIGYRAFDGCSGFTGSLTIGNSMTSIYEDTFYGCNGFTGSLTIGNSVTSIGNRAFYCSGFTGSLTIGNSVTSIGNRAFYCSGFTGNLTVPNSVTTIGDFAFSGCSGFTGSLTIGDSVTSIGSGAFSGCSGFTGNLTVPNSVTTIGDDAFSGCSGFTGSLTIGDSVTSIGYGAFSGCSGFTGNLTVPNSVTTIGNYAFSYCHFTSVISFAETPPMLLGNNTFWSGHSTTPVYVPCGFDEAYSSLSWGGFVNFMGLCAGEITTIANPAEGGTVSGAGYYEGGATCTLVATANTGYTFINWMKDGIVVSSSETYSFIIAGDATYVANFSEEGAITFADANVKALCVANWDTNGDGELSYAEAAAVTSLGEVFRNQSSITSFDELQFFISLTSIGYRAFYNCTGLTSIEIPNSVTTIGEAAFFDCIGLTSIEIPNSVTSIGFMAFSDCFSLISIQIPDSVTSIEYGAFSGCISLTSVIVLADNPPTLDDDVFYEVNMGIFVYVPCESVEAYEAENWGGFNNFIGMCAGEITVIANPAEGGTVTGGGYYEGGAACTLTATANIGYTFINWTKDGVEVSNSGTYSFFVGGDASFVANFEQGLIIGSGTATNEYLPSYSYYCYTLSQQIYTADEVGSDGIINSIAFFNAGATKTRSYDVYMVSTEKTVFENSHDWIAVTENDLVFSGQVTVSADTWTVFQFDTPFLYDGVSNIALVVDDNTGSWTSFPNMACRVFNAQGNQAIQVYDDYSNYDPHYPSGYTGTLFSVKNQIKLGIMPLTGGQTCTLSQGWNWWSTYIEQEGIDGLTMLENSLGANGHQIKSQTDFVTNYGTMWMGMLTSINNEETYMLDNYSACQVVLTGAPASPADHPITVSSGWNWIGYPCTNTMSVAEAFSGFTPSNGDQVKSQSDYAMYYGGMWIGQLQNIVPGTGLMYKSNSPTTNTLVYPDGGRSTEMTTSPRATHWTNDIHAYPNNMTVMAVVELDDVELTSDSYELAAFANGECRGSVRLMYVEPIDRHVAFLTVSGKDAAELSFRLYDTETGTEYYDANESLGFVTNAIVGDADDLYSIHFRGTTGMDEFASSVKVYPNPVNRGEQFSIGMVDEVTTLVRVEIINAIGVETLRATSVQMPATLTAPTTAGVYTLRITVEGKGTIVRKLVVK